MLPYTSFRVIHEEREKRKIRKTFSQYLSPGVIALIAKDPREYIRLGGEVKELTVMFSDIRDFTTLSEGLTPDELVNLLNECLSAMTDILFRNFARSTNTLVTRLWRSGDLLFRSRTTPCTPVAALWRSSPAWRN
jgi:hypothetical protein